MFPHHLPQVTFQIILTSPHEISGSVCSQADEGEDWLGLYRGAAGPVWEFCFPTPNETPVSAAPDVLCSHHPNSFRLHLQKKTDSNRHRDPTNPSSTRDLVSNVTLKGTRNVFVQPCLPPGFDAGLRVGGSRSRATQGLPIDGLEWLGSAFFDGENEPKSCQATNHQLPYRAKQFGFP